MRGSSPRVTHIKTTRNSSRAEAAQATMGVTNIIEIITFVRDFAQTCVELTAASMKELLTLIVSLRRDSDGSIEKIREIEFLNKVFVCAKIAKSVLENSVNTLQKHLDTRSAQTVSIKPNLLKLKAELNGLATFIENNESDIAFVTNYLVAATYNRTLTTLINKFSELFSSQTDTQDRAIQRAVS